MNSYHVVILAAGLGSRLASTRPKCLNVLPDGRTILRQQIGNIREVLGPGALITIVVGFRPLDIIEHVPDVAYVFNSRFAETNTNRSLLAACRRLGGGHLIWMNGDVVFDPEVLARVRAAVDAGSSVVAVNNARVAQEEVKYTLDSMGRIRSLSKTVDLREALGEAVGVNAVHALHRAWLDDGLEACADGDYFERGVEIMIEEHGAEVAAVDISDVYAVEVDTPDDLEHARAVYAGVLQARDVARATAQDWASEALEREAVGR